MQTFTKYFKGASKEKKMKHTTKKKPHKHIKVQRQVIVWEPYKRNKKKKGNKLNKVINIDILETKYAVCK